MGDTVSLVIDKSEVGHANNYTVRWSDLHHRGAGLHHP